MRYTTKGFKYEADTPMERLQELEDKIEDGVIIEPPCKIGQTVYRISGNYSEAKIYEGIVDHVIVHYDDSEVWFYISGHPLHFTEDNFGKTVFLTRAEAEKVLAERKDLRRKEE